MQNDTKDNPAATDRLTGLVYQAATGAAVVAGVFCLFAAVLLVFNYIRTETSAPAREAKLQEMKSIVSQGKGDEKLVAEICQLDLQIRSDNIRRRQFAQRGAILFVCFLAVFFASLKIAGQMRKNLPVPPGRFDIKSQQVTAARRARLAVTAGLVFIGSVGIYLSLLESTVPAEESGGAEVSYASMEEAAVNWPVFRGPAGDGVSAYSNIPTKWDAPSGRGILWKSPVELKGHNSPVVWGGKIFISGADRTIRKIYCYDAESGALLWAGEVSSGQGAQKEMMEDTGYAPSTAATDGRRVCAIFPNGDIGCFTADGRKLWCKNLGRPESAYGYASSLAMYENLVLIQYDQGSDAEEGKSRMIALDWMSGQVVWEVKRPVPNSWTSPIVAKVGTAYELITCGSPWVIAYNPGNGQELWRAGCVGGDVAPSPIYTAGKVIAVEPYNRLVAINAQAATGDVTQTHIAWQADGDIPDIASPAGNGQFVWLLSTEGMLTCYDVMDGSIVWEQKLKGSFFASPSVVQNKVYIISDTGTTVIIEAGRQYAEIGQCELGEGCYASPAFADGRIYLRGKDNLYCIGGTD